MRYNKLKRYEKKINCKYPKKHGLSYIIDKIISTYMASLITTNVLNI